ncbi:SdrD B-like domain-containing protein [Amycolatopsis kentuckyensis]|uniref:SdrD B-like domain-containing protein n=1 Tax=Amycolatopsis kentuckyensis TaxID=218823 RepID=UPI001FC94AE5|nr:SdrD B-like domain-containing protein [Amycolatopsis kentuckyensis]
MNISRSARSVARGFAALTAAAVLTSAFAGPAAADPAPESPAAPSTSEAPADPPESTPPAPSPTQPESKPAAAQPRAERAQVAVSLVFDKDSYRTDEDIRFTVKLTNTGATTAAGLTMYQMVVDSTDVQVLYGGWGQLQDKPGVTLEPGKSFELAVSGKVRDLEATTATVRGILFDESGNSAGSQFGFTVPVTKAAGHATGTVYGDKNGNGVLDAGEQLAGTKVTLRYVHGSGTYTATTGPDGKFALDLPAAEYYLGGEVIDGWLFSWRTVRIGSDTDLLLRGAPPLNGALKATMAFTQDTYKVGDLAHVTVTLSNSGPIPLTGIVAACNRVGSGFVLSGRGPGWGDLAADGVTIAPGQTRTFDVSETVPQAAFNRGYVLAACDFGYPEVDTENHAEAQDRAAVPGAKGTVVGDVKQGEQGVAGVKVVLVSDQHCPVTGEQTTDAKGHFEFHDVVPGPEYRLYLLPPKGLKVKYENPTAIDVWGSSESRVGIDVEEGDAPLPVVPVNPADCTAGAPTSTTGPAGGTGGGQSGGSGLASTGVDAIGLGALALLALALGGGLVFGARRRRSA